MRFPALLSLLFVIACGPKAAAPAEEPEQKRMTVSSTTIEILDRVTFDADSAELSAGSNPTLDAIASTLEGNPKITKIEVQGHADPGEDNADELAQARAEVVAAYLVSMGLDAARVTTRGYGADPWATANEGEDQAEVNRGVSFEILETSE